MINNDIKEGDIVRIKSVRSNKKYLKGFWRVMRAYATNRYLEKVNVRNINGKGHRERIHGHRVEKLNSIDYMKLKKEGLI